MRRRVLLALVILFLIAGAARAQRAVLVVRHAEKQSDSNDPATPLSEAGRARARRLAELLKDAGIAAIYSTDFERTRATVEPLARRLNLTVRTYSAQAPEGQSASKVLAERVRREHPRDIVLVTGHSNTVPDLLKTLGSREEIRIGADEYDNLFVVVPGEAGGDAVAIRLRY